MIRTILFDYYATGEGSVLQFVIVNNNRGIENFFELFKITDDKDKDWYRIGLEEHDGIPEIVSDCLSQKIIENIKEKEEILNIELCFLLHRNL